jgi:hypothetical protein
MSVFSDNIKSRSITEQVFDFAVDEYLKISGSTSCRWELKTGDELYTKLVQQNFPDWKTTPWSYYIMKGMDRLKAITGKTYDFHVEKWGSGNGYLTGLTKAIVVTEV